MRATIAQEARTEAAAAMLVAGSDEAAGGALHFLNVPQAAVLAASGSNTVIMGPVPFSNQSNATTEVTGVVSGFFGAGTTSATATLAMSIGGGIFTPVQVIQLDGSGPTVGGSLAGTGGGGTFAISIPGLPLNPAIATRFEVFVSPVGGSFTTTASHGNLMLVEA